MNGAVIWFQNQNIIKFLWFYKQGVNFKMNNEFDGKPCRPTDFGFCQQHATCNCVMVSFREAQVKAAILDSIELPEHAWRDAEFKKAVALLWSYFRTSLTDSLILKHPPH